MSETPLVSVITIFYNEARFIEEAIESVLAQTYEHWELLLVDDGSTDDSTRIARQFAERYAEKVKYLEHEGHENRGMSATRNLGLRHAMGEYISYIDGDDVWLPNKLADQVELARQNPEAAMVFGPILRWYSWTGNPEDKEREFLAGFGLEQVHPFPDQVVEPPELLKLILRDEYFIPSGLLIERDKFEALGGYEEQFRGMYEDTVFLSKLLLKHPVYVSSTVWYLYRAHPDACTIQTSQQGQDEAAMNQYLKWLERYFDEQKVRDRELLALFRALRHRIRKAAFKRMLKRWLRSIRRRLPGKDGS